MQWLSAIRTSDASRPLWSWWQPAHAMRASLSSGFWFAWWRGPAWHDWHFASLWSEPPTNDAVHLFWPIGVNGTWQASHWLSQEAWARVTAPCVASARSAPTTATSCGRPNRARSPTR